RSHHPLPAQAAHRIAGDREEHERHDPRRTNQPQAVKLCTRDRRMPVREKRAPNEKGADQQAGNRLKQFVRQARLIRFAHAATGWSCRAKTFMSMDGWQANSMRWF